jgi:hypothetical protein
VPIWEADGDAGLGVGAAGSVVDDEWEDEGEDEGESEDWVDLEADDAIGAQGGGGSISERTARGVSAAGSMLGR